MDESLFVNLKVLAKLEPFQKINTRGRLFKVTASSDTTSYLPEFIKRWWDGSTRGVKEEGWSEEPLRHHNYASRFDRKCELTLRRTGALGTNGIRISARSSQGNIA